MRARRAYTGEAMPAMDSPSPALSAINGVNGHK